MGPRHRAPTKRTLDPPRKAPSPNAKGTRGNAQIRGRTPKKGDHPRIMEPLRRKLLFRQKERREAKASPGLPTYQQMDQEEPQRIPTDSPNHRPAQQKHSIHKI